MAELATGAVSTLLGVISNEAVRLGRVRGDVQFIQEEMESISSFLANLSTTRRDHNDQVRTWMNQVRILANDCNNCIDLYLYRGNPEFHLARSGLRRYLGWASWLLRKLLAQHRAAGQLRELKERARDIGERRLRYGVKVKTESSTMAGAGLTAPALSLAATQDHEEEEKVVEEDDDDDEEDQDGGDPLKVALSMTTMSMDKEEYFKWRLENWIGPVVLAAEVDYFKERLGHVVPATPKKRKPLPSIGFVAPEPEDADALVREAQAVAKRVEEAHVPAHEDEPVPPSPETKDAGAPVREALDAANAHVERAEEVHARVPEDEALPPPPEAKDAGAPAREALDAANAYVEQAEEVHAPVHEDEAMPPPPETEDTGAPAREALDAANVHVERVEEVQTPVHDDEAVPLPLETEDAGAPAREALDAANIHVELAEEVHAPVHEDEAVPPPPETEDADALARQALDAANVHVERVEEVHAPVHAAEAVPPPPETEAAGAPAREALNAANAHVKRAEEVNAPVHEDEVVPPPLETKDAGAPASEALDAANAHVERAEEVHAPVHQDEAVPQPPETKDAGAPACEALDAANAHVKQAEEVHASVNEDKAVPPSLETEDKMRRALEEANFHLNRAEELTRALAHEDEAVALPPDAADLARKELAVARAHFKQAHQDGAVLKMQIKWNVILVDVPAVHFFLQPLRPEDILYYILHELKHLKPQPQDQQQGGAPPTRRTIWAIYVSKKDTISDVKDKIRNMKVEEKIEKIKKKVCKVDRKDVKKLEMNLTDSEEKNTDKPLEQLLWMLVKFTAAAEQDQENKGMPRSAASYHDIIKKTAKKLKREIEGYSISQEEASEYEDILQEVFPRATTTTTATTNTLVGGEIKQIIHEVKDMLHELRELDREPTAQSREAAFEKTTEGKMKEIQTKIKKQLKIKKIVEKIKERLGDDERILVILKTDDKYVSKWDEARHTLSLLQGFSAIAGAMIVANQHDKEDSRYARLGLIEYSLVGCYLDAVLQTTRQHMHEESCHIVRDILCQCEPHELCMKIFAHALYTNRKRSSEDLRKLQDILHSSATQKSLTSIARKMLKFSYRDLPKEYKSCLLYLAIFPQGHKMRRSTLIGRWVTEGLITTKDWLWSFSVDEAGKCFDTLVARCLVSPVDIGATGKVKSCKVDKLVHGFITKIAMKQRILETRLSHHLARHFSIFSDVRLRRSDEIEHYLKNVHESSQFSKLKVLDLEGCGCFPENQRYLRDICSKILMLKYLSLRGTGVNCLTSQINNLHELEVLDIRQTKIPVSATRNVLLRKLKRLLAGHADSSVLIPEKIEKMQLVEVLSNVKPQVRQDLDDITKLEKLKKLGVVINKGSHLQLLFKAIRNLQNLALRSLSITLDITKHTECLPLHIIKHTESSTSPEKELRASPKVLESLSIIGSIQDCELLTLFANDGIGNPLAKVTLSGTSLSQNDLKVLAKLPKLCCVRLRHIKDHDTKLIFNKDGFQTLKNLLVEGLNIIEIRFDNGAASKLEKIVLSSTTHINSINGVECLQNLEELELKNIDKDMVCSLLADAKHIAKVTLRGTSLKQGDLQELAHKPKMRCLTLLENSYIDSELIFNKDEFQKLNLLSVYSSEITKIRFTGGSPKLEKIFWSFNNIDSLSGIDKLPRLKELELNGAIVPKDVEEAIKKQKNRVDYIYRSKPLNQDQATGNRNARGADGVAR